MRVFRKAAKKGRLVLLSGASGVGKSRLIEELKSKGFQTITSHATRPMRPGEQNGNPYYFTEREDFLRMKAAGKFLVGMEFNGEHYGASIEEFEKKLEQGNVAFDLAYVGLDTVKAKYPEAISIMLLPESMEILDERLKKRGTSPQETKARYELTQITHAHHFKYDYLIGAHGEVVENKVNALLAILAGKGEQYRTPTFAVDHQALFSRLAIKPVYAVLRDLLPEVNLLNVSLRAAVGLSNTSFFVTLEEGMDPSFVLRLPSQRNSLVMNLQHEIPSMLLAQRLGLFPAKLRHYSEKAVLVDCISNLGTLFPDNVKGNEAQRFAAIGLLKRLHDCNPELMGHTHNQVANIKRVKTSLIGESALPEGFSEVYDEAFDIAKQLQASIIEYVPCHNDPTAFNFLRRPDGSLSLVDYEFAGKYDPLYDLANFSTQSNLDDEQDEELLREYYHRDPSEQEIARLNCFKIVTNLWLVLWFEYKRQEGQNSFDDKFMRTVLIAPFFEKLKKLLEIAKKNNYLERSLAKSSLSAHSF